MSNLLSSRVKALSVSATIAMAQKARELKGQGKDIISLSLGEPDFKTPENVQIAAKDAIDSGKFFSYPPVPGYPELREAIVKKLKDENEIDCTTDQIVVSSGAKHSISNVFLATLDEGDEVIIYAPYWVSYVDMVKLAGGVPVVVEGTIEQEFKASAEQLEAAITDKTKAIIFSSPCNPTGAVWSKEELEAMAAVVKKYEDIFVIADEIYEYINFTGKHASIAAVDGMADRVVTVNGFSKGYAMTGWRVGYICAPVEIAKACSKLQGQTTSGICSIAQRAAIEAISGDQSSVKVMADAYHERRALVKGLLDEIPGVKSPMPEGAFYFFPDVSAYFGTKAGDREINNASDLAMFLLEEANVSTVTGDAFGSPNCIRLSYAASEENLKEALKRIKATLATLK
ncbi:aminotransferase [Fulvitalea axinellae]|uniref:Aminotransferase n=1 Tax=Fulvitalea axinellae TaxID=1182444 RepID=A0AAU9D590_9BACT|nr:aminotransferase [Fulvitalea axinellae]